MVAETPSRGRRLFPEICISFRAGTRVSQFFLPPSLQIAAILALIAVHGKPLWVSALLYVAVAVTVLSGLDYFFGVRKLMAARSGAQADG